MIAIRLPGAAIPDTLESPGPESLPC